MRRLRIIFRICLFVLLGLSLHYVLPQKDIVQVTQTETRRTDFGGLNRWFFAQADAGTAELANRDVLYIYGDKKRSALFGLIPREGERVIVYRNEDTGWIWPPYFKFDSSNLQAEAASLGRDGEQWAIVTHYGWRVPFLSIFPNAVNIEPTETPDARPFPWFNLFFFACLLIGFFFVRAMWMQLRERSLDPLVDSAQDRIDEAQAGVAERRGRFRNWLNTWRSKDNQL
ncbi:MAG: DUF1523 family protein [Pseudomonadota bacterium]